MKLVAPTGYPKAQAIRLTAQIANIALDFEPIEWKKVNTPEFLARNPQGSVPILETNNEVISESNAILRHIARLSGSKGLYGENHFDSAQVDAYLDFNNSEVQPMAFALTSPIFGWVPFNQDRYTLAKQDLAKLFKILDDHLQMRTYLVGQKMTIADIAVVATLIPVFKFIMDEEARKQFANLTRWFLHITAQPIFVLHFGKIHLTKKEWTLEGQSQVSLEQQQQEVKQQKPEKKEKKKQEPKKKAEKKVEKKVEEKKAEPEKPKGNPLDLLPPSKFNLFDFKTQITNAADKKESVKFLVDNFDPEGFSVYYVEYERYEGEGIKLFLTSNFKDSVLQRLDHFRKYAYGVHGVYGEEGNYEVHGVWIWRGVGIPQEIKDLPNYDYHKWIKMDIVNNKEDRQLLEDAWTGLEEDKSVVKGRVARDITCFK